MQYDLDYVDHETCRLEPIENPSAAKASIIELKHTFGRRLRAAGVSFEDRQDLLGHRSGRITSHYSAAELTSLIEAANKVVGQGSRTGNVEEKSGERLGANRLI